MNCMIRQEEQKLFFVIKGGGHENTKSQIWLKIGMLSKSRLLDLNMAFVWRYLPALGR